MTSISARRCFNHARREAVARCPVCGSFFCRECVTEHDGRMVCARCLIPAAAGSGRHPRLRAAWRGVQFLAGVLVLWLCFWFMGRTLLRLPSSFHEGASFDGVEAKR